MGDVVVLEDFKPHGLWQCVCSSCGKESVVVAPVGVPWPGECDCGEWANYPQCQDCGLPAVHPDVGVHAGSLALMGEVTTEIEACQCWWEV